MLARAVSCFPVRGPPRGSDYFIDRYRQDAFLLLCSTNFEFAAEALSLVIDHLMSVTKRKPHSGAITSREDGHAAYADAGR